MAAIPAETRAISCDGEPDGGSLLRFWAPKYWLAWLLIAWLRIASTLPWRFSVRMHKSIGTAVWFLLPQRRQIVERSIAEALPGIGREELRMLVRRHFQNLGACLAETAFAWFGKVDESLAEFELEGDEHVYSALASGRGVILYTGHFTPIEICAPILKAHFPFVGFMFHQPGNPLIDAFSRRGRRYAAHVSFSRDKVRAMLHALKQRAVVWYAPDQCYSNKGSIQLSHFGLPMNVSTATCRLARMSGACIVPFAYYRKPDDSGYVLRFDPPVEQGSDDRECTQRLLRRLENFIAGHPDQYAWTPNRLRNRRARTDSEAGSAKDLRAGSRAARILFAVLGVALFITVFDNGPFFRSLIEETRTDSHRWAIFSVMSLLIPTSLLLVLCMAWGARLFKATAATLLIVAAAVGYYMSSFGIVIDPSMIRNLAETDAREASPLLTTAAVMHILGFGALPALIVCWIPLDGIGWRREIAVRFGAVASALVLLSTVAYLNLGAVSYFGHEHHELRMQMNPVYPLYSLARYLTRDDDKPPANRQPLDAWRPSASGTRSKPTLLVFVMGETARADRFAYNGYTRDTNAFTRPHDVINFPQVSACGTSTADSLPCIFSRFGRTEFSHAKFAANESLFQTLERLGIEASWLDNSTGCKHICDPDSFVQLAGENDAELCHDNVCVDEILLRDFAANVADSSRDHFLVLHQRGSHGPAYHTDTPGWAKEYLPECNLANPQDCDLEAINNAYDNTVRYTDFFLAQLIELLKGEADRYETGMLYVSDHGESLGEKGLYLHGLPYSMAPTEQTEVPMIFWASPGLYARTSVDAGCLHQASSRPTTHAAIFHTVLSLFEIQSSAYNRDLDLLASCRSPRDHAAPMRASD